MAAGMPVRDDTIGQLIANQVYWSLPGIDHLAHGIDIFSSQEQPARLFEFTYCSLDDASILQDAYRGNVYQLPYQVFISESQL